MKKILLVITILLGFQTYGQITLIPDSNFEEYLVNEGIDTDGIVNGQVATADIETVSELFISDLGIDDLTGIEDFLSLEVLYCASNLNLESIDISNNTQLREMNIEFCDISTIDFSNNPNLEYLYLAHNNLTSLSFTNHPALETLICGNPEIDVGPFNQIPSFDFSGAPNVRYLDVSVMDIDVAIDFTEIPLLETFVGSYCSFTSLDFSSLSSLTTLQLGDYFEFGQSNNFTSIDVSNNPNLENIDVRGTGVSALNLKNGNNALLTSVLANANNSLFCIQVDDENAANAGAAPYANWLVDPQVVFSEDCTLGITDNNVEAIVLYPNPTAKVLQLTNTLGAIPEVVQIFSVEGSLLFQQQQNNTVVDVANLAAGFYILKATKGQAVFTASFIKI